MPTSPQNARPGHAPEPKPRTGHAIAGKGYPWRQEKRQPNGDQRTGWGPQSENTKAASFETAFL